MEISEKCVFCDVHLACLDCNIHWLTLHMSHTIQMFHAVDERWYLHTLTICRIKHICGHKLHAYHENPHNYNSSNGSNLFVTTCHLHLFILDGSQSQYHS